MKNIIFIAIFSLYLSGCAGMSTAVFNEISLGDSAEKLKDRFGTPDEFRPLDSVPGSEAWIYRTKKDSCIFGIKDNIILAKRCDANPNYVNPFAAALQGMGKGLAAKSTNCTSIVNGNFVNTTCD